MNNTIEYIAGLVDLVREKCPLVHQITNAVTANDCANATLAIGASPIMADDPEDAVDVTAAASSLVLNIGTLSQWSIPAMLGSGRIANERCIPVVLDPVGAGVSSLRNRTVDQILRDIRLNVVRGNLSEIRFLAGYNSAARGVDASAADLGTDIEWVMKTASKLSQMIGAVVAITGGMDVLSDGQAVLLLGNGTPMLSRVTGTGCMATALIGCFLAVTDNALMAAVAGIICMGIAGELADLVAGGQGTGSFRTALIDELSKLDSQTVILRGKIRETRI